MDFLLNLVTIILGTYLSLTNSLATEIALLLPEKEGNNSSYSASLDGELIHIESKSKFGNIPDILIKNAAYQNAAVIDSIEPETAPATALEALVNIYCTYTTDNYTKTTTGTGFLIDTDGIILTNAHVAQFLLLEGLVGEAECIIRTGDPATPMYKAQLLYIPPAWIREHAELINDHSPRGTGERDYALLYINEALNNQPMPSKFVALPFDINLMTLGTLNTEVFATGYPAEAALENGFDSPLIPKQATTSIGELMTFGSNYVDVFTIRGTAIGEHGSSGGPVVNSEGKAVGIISTKGDDTAFGDGSLRAVTISYIDRTIKEETGFTLTQNLGGNLPYRALLFKQTLIPFLQQILKQEL